MKILKINYQDQNDYDLMEAFLEKLTNDTAIETFRYFSKRDINSIKNHIITILLLEESNEIIGYGHIDKENNNYWLGVCVLSNFWNRGYGKTIIKYLLETQNNKEYSICLSVDKHNVRAIELYKSFGFLENGSKENILFMILAK